MLDLWPSSECSCGKSEIVRETASKSLKLFRFYKVYQPRNLEKLTLLELPETIPRPIVSLLFFLFSIVFSYFLIVHVRIYSNVT